MVERNKGKVPVVVKYEWRSEEAVLEFARDLGRIAADLWRAGKLKLDGDTPADPTPSQLELKL